MTGTTATEPGHVPVVRLGTGVNARGQFTPGAARVYPLTAVCETCDGQIRQPHKHAAWEHVAPLTAPPEASPTNQKYRNYARTYSRLSGEVSMFAGHRTWDEAARDAASIITSRDVTITSVWIRGIEDNGSLGPVIWFTGLDPTQPHC